MTERQFYNLVERMRNAQKEYFRTRAIYYLNLSKDLEKQVDLELERYNREYELKGQGVPLPFDAFNEVVER